MDIAGIGENPTTRSGPYVLTVCTCAAAMSSVTSGQVERTKPPLPRAFLYRVAEPAAGLPPHSQQFAAHVRVADPGGGVGVPGERRAARAATGLVLRRIRASGGIVGLLRLPGDDPVFDVHLPRARPGAVHAVCGPHHLVVPPPLAVELLSAAPAPPVYLPEVRAGSSAGNEVLRSAQQCLDWLAGRQQRGQRHAALRIGFAHSRPSHPLDSQPSPRDALILPGGHGPQPLPSAAVGP